MSSVWVVKDEMDGECYVYLAATEEKAIDIGAQILRDWYDGDKDESEKVIGEFLASVAKNNRFFAYSSNSGFISIEKCEVMA